MDNHHRAPALPLQPAPPSPPQTLAARSFSEKETDVDYSKAFPFLLEINKVLQVQGSPWDSDKAIYHPVWLSQFDHTEPKEANGPTGQFCLCVDAPSTLLPPFQCPLTGTDVLDQALYNLDPFLPWFYHMQWGPKSEHASICIFVMGYKILQIILPADNLSEKLN